MGAKSKTKGEQALNKSQQYAADGRRTPFPWLLRRHSKVAAVLSVINFHLYMEVIAMSAQALCSISDLTSYLSEIGELHLLDNIEPEGDRHGLSQTYWDREENYAKSIRLQVAAMLAVLGEFERAEEVHKMAWEILSPSFDKVANGIIQRFVQSWPNL